MTSTAQAAQKAKPPIAKLRLGLINANIWQRQAEERSFYTVTFERRYKNAHDEWDSADSFNLNDLLPLAKLIDQAHSAIITLQDGDRT